MNTDNGHKLVLISRFATRAKKVIGHVSTSQLSSDGAFATEVILKAIFSKDLDLAELAKNLSVELDLNLNLIRAMELYYDACKANRLTDQLRFTRTQLIELSQHLYNITSVDGYRGAVAPFLEGLSEKEKAAGLDLIREFYSFWYKEEQIAIPIEDDDFLQRYVFKKSDADTKLFEKWNKVDDVTLTDAELQVLQRYMEILVSLSIGYNAVKVRKKMGKLILIELRNYTNSDSNSYRAAVSKIQSLIKSKDLKTFFSYLSREFYYYWSNHPEAEKHISIVTKALNIALEEQLDNL
jgi:hypothetical protein